MRELLKIASWNIKGINPVPTKTKALEKYLNAAEPDIICLQEVRIQEHQFQKERIIEIFKSDRFTSRYSAFYFSEGKKPKGIAGILVGIIPYQYRQYTCVLLGNIHCQWNRQYDLKLLGSIQGPISFFEDVNGTEWVGWTDTDGTPTNSYNGYLAILQGQLNYASSSSSSSANVLTALFAFVALCLVTVFAF